MHLGLHLYRNVIYEELTIGSGPKPLQFPGFLGNFMCLEAYNGREQKKSQARLHL